MIVVHSPLHALHEPPRELSGGREVPAFEVAARATSILTALEADTGFQLETCTSFRPQRKLLTMQFLAGGILASLIASQISGPVP